MMSVRLPGPGRIKLSPMLGHDGRLKGDLTLLNWDEGTWWIMGSYYLRAWHMRWFNSQREEGVTVRDLSDAVVGFGLSGPKSRHLMELVAHEDVSDDAFRFMACREMDIGPIRAKVGRISVTGELGYEIHCSAVEHNLLRKTLLRAGREVDAVEYGFNAMGSLRMEKSFGIWSKEFRQDYTPGMTGMDRWIDWSKDFVGVEAAREEHDADSAELKLVTLEIDALDADGSEYEPVWSDGQRVGYVTSGEYGHVVDKSLAMALIDREHCEVGTELTTHVVGVERPARVIEASPYDPDGSAMRG
jgi:dimethylglycine dehydrogenase